MKELLEKISSYNLLNYLFPGVLFVVLLKEITSYSFVQDDLIIAAFVYYFVGLVISRFGSLIIEPVLRKSRFLKFADYAEYVAASKKHKKIEMLSEVNNMYRTLVATLSMLLLFKLYNLIESNLSVLKDWNIYVLLGLLLVIFLFSYRKQTDYITKRIKANR